MRTSTGSIYFLCGLSVGAALATIFAARSGAETRSQIASAVNTGLDQMKAKASDISKMMDDTLEAGRQLVQDRARDITAAVEAGKQAYRDSIAMRPGRMA